jgi:hypothetical protein
MAVSGRTQDICGVAVIGEEVLLITLKLATRAAATMRNTLRRNNIGLDEQALARVQTEIKVCDRISSFISHALENLPDDPQERAVSIAGHLDTIEFLTKA